jgi:hypothetical protein
LLGINSEQIFEFIGRGLIGGTEGMPVYVHCGCDTAMSQPGRNNFSVDSLINEQLCRCMAQVMEADIPGSVLFYELSKPQVRAFVMKGSAVRMGE